MVKKLRAMGPQGAQKMMADLMGGGGGGGDMAQMMQGELEGERWCNFVVVPLSSLAPLC